MNCNQCGLPIFHGASGYAGPMCQCHWRSANHNPDQQSSLTKLQADNAALRLALDNSGTRHIYEAPDGMCFMPEGAMEEIDALKEQVAQLQEQVDLQIPKMAFAELQSKSAMLVEALIKLKAGGLQGFDRDGYQIINAALAAFKGEK